MTLVFNEPREGPATHALIIGVQTSAETRAGPFSAAVTAHGVADLVLKLDFPDAPLASVDLHTSYSYIGANYQSPRDGSNHHVESSILGSIRRAVRRWHGDLQSHPDNLSFFYFAGPTFAFESGSMLMIPDDLRDSEGGMAFDDLWRGMGAGEVPMRQLYFVDGCPVGGGFREVRAPVAKLFEGVAWPRTDLARALYEARLASAPTPAPGRQPSLLLQALTAVLEAREAVGTNELGSLLAEEFSLRLATVDLEVSERLHLDLENDFVLRYRIAAPPPVPPTGKSQQKEKRWTAIGDDDGVVRKLGESAEDAEIAGRRREVLYAQRVAKLTPRQRECLGLVRAGLLTKEIASRLKIAPVTVNRHLLAAEQTLGVGNRSAAARLFAEYGGEAEPAQLRPAEEQAKPESAPPRSPEPNTHFVSDDPEVERDELNRGPLAIALGRRLHRIWCRSNGIAVPGDETGASLPGESDGRSAFVLHLDAPWGGGKTSFANFLARVLNPFPAGNSAPAHFLAARGGDDNRVGTIFLDDPEARTKSGAPPEWAQDARRPWIIVPFNAWQAEHCAPPWWVFYQAIRQGCFRAVWAEGTNAADFAQAGPPRRPSLPVRLWDFARLWRRELWWRMRNPKIVALLSTFVVTAALTYVLWRMDLVFSGERGPAFATGNALGFVLAGVTGISGLWGLGALLRDSVAPGTDDMAERRSLGGGDPLDRFRRHFRKMIAAVRRPVIVIVDDLDRCRPDFVVDLVRGIQTLLQSPRVVFVILGDRDWIERAFESHHEAMSKVNVGAEQSFGARFVEKAIQMSFILPEMPDGHQDSYVRRVLLGPAAAATGSNAPAPAALSEQLRADYREEIAGAETTEQRKAVEEKLREKYRPVLKAAAQAAAPEGDGAEPEAAAAADEQAGKLIGEERALLAAVDERMGQALLHRLEPLARFFPPNPRQIKRIVNAITMYTCVAYLQMDMDEDDNRGIELAIWVIVMTEWPETWRLLASCPKLADVLAAKDMKAALAAIDESELPGSRVSTLKEAQRIRADRALFDLITRESEERPRLRAESVALFADLTPLYSRKKRLADDAAAPAAAPRAPRKGRPGTVAR